MKLTQAQIEKFNSDIEKYNELVKKYRSSDLSDSEIDSLYKKGRKIIEWMSKMHFDKKPTKLIKEKEDIIAQLMWGEINKPEHIIVDEHIEPKSFILYLEHFYSKYNNDGLDTIKLESLEDDNFIEDWRDSEKKNDQNLINKFYIIKSFFKSGSKKYSAINTKCSDKQKKGCNKFEFFSDQFLFPENNYHIVLKKQFLYANGKKTKIYRYFATKTVLKTLSRMEDEEFVRLKNSIINKYDTPAFHFYIANFDVSSCEEIMNINRTILRIYDNREQEDLKWIRDVIKLFVILKYSSKFIIDKNSSQYIPMQFEFWTKPIYKSVFTMWEKRMIFNILKMLGVNTDVKPFFGYENKKFELEMIRKQEYFFESEIDIDSKFPTNNWFDSKNKQYKIVDINLGNNKRIITVDKYKLLIEMMKSVFAEETKYKINSSFNLEDLSDDKKEAFEGIVNRRISIITAPAGYGKTKLASKLIEQFDSFGEKTLFVGPTIKATKVGAEMSEISTPENMTIQNIEKKQNCGILEKYENIIIDEITMISDDCWLALFKEISRKNKRIILIGDPNQIPPIYSIGFSKIIFLQKDHIYELKENHRQKDNPLLKEFVENFRNNKSIKNNDFYTLYTDIESFINKFSAIGEYDVYISPIHGGIFGTDSINLLKSNTDLGEYSPGEKLIVNETVQNFKTILYADRILTIKEVYEECITFKEKIKGEKDWDAKYRGFSLENGELTFYPGWLEENPFRKARSITSHSSQGSTFDSVCVVIPPNWKFDDKIFYTSISRASKNLLVLLPDNIIKKNKSLF